MARHVEMELRGRLRRLFANLGLKIFALLLATAVWFLIASGRVAYREVEAPVELKGVPEGVTVDGPEPANVSLRVAGKGRDLFRLRPTDFKVVINLADEEVGAHIFELTPADVIYSGGEGIAVEEILSEKAVAVELERRVTKAVPVKVDFSGSPRVGYYLGLAEVAPAKATLYGSAAVLEKVRAVSVAVDVEGRDAPFAADVPIRAPAGITLVGGDEARVTVPVGPGERRTISGVRVTARGVDAGAYELTPAEVSVTIEGEPGRLAAPGVVAAAVYPRGPGRYQVRVDVPDYVTFVAVAPREVEAAPAGGAK
ncbi:MAG TPA: CdaR family protein [bacterium]|nr:CdaR family protein [bacterium]